MKSGDSVTLRLLARPDILIRLIYLKFSINPPPNHVQDTAIGDKIIPAGANVMYNTFTLHMDKKCWGDPENFRQYYYSDIM